MDSSPKGRSVSGFMMCLFSEIGAFLRDLNFESGSKGFLVTLEGYNSLSAHRSVENNNNILSLCNMTLHMNLNESAQRPGNQLRHCINFLTSQRKANSSQK